ncbi:hypothetical protein GO730_18870 [Spirosoma sp. HMF3257]|uniref:Uncharacterized protein n=2 Tax=Spirosoma telluris TaxID=2183553 RepID=A0A327NWV0_9BACT|nr:hypothetical protein [Spirosoma telluris]RAI78506.1 hypothetical protein HMF3257_18800 [Spirosoma telluris]
MEERKVKYPFKTILEKYISEILVIFIGISISFFFDEWRENRKDDETVKKHLTVLRTNLVQDTLKLTVMINHGHKLVNSINKLTYFKFDSEIKDSISFHIDNAASYLVFKPNQMAYEEIKQTAHTNLIKNDSLKTSFLSYYTSTIPYCTEWCKIDETHTMTQLIPEMSIYFPVVIDSLNIISSKEKIKALKVKKLRNLLLANTIYKKETINTFVFTKKATINLLKRVDDELRK